MLNLNEQGPRWYPEEQQEMKSSKRQTPPERGWQKPSRTQNKVQQTCSPGLARLERKCLNLGDDGVVIGRGAGVTKAEKRNYLSEREIISRFYPGKEAD